MKPSSRRRLRTHSRRSSSNTLCICLPDLHIERAVLAACRRRFFDLSPQNYRHISCCPICLCRDKRRKGAGGGTRCRYLDTIFESSSSSYHLPSMPSQDITAASNLSFTRIHTFRTSFPRASANVESYHVIAFRNRASEIDSSKLWLWTLNSEWHQ